MSELKDGNFSNANDKTISNNNAQAEANKANASGKNDKTINNSARDNVSLKRKAASAAVSGAGKAVGGAKKASQGIKNTVDDTTSQGSGEAADSVGESGKNALKRSLNTGIEGAKLANKLKNKIKQRNGGGKPLSKAGKKSAATAAKGAKKAAKLAKESAKQTARVAKAIIKAVGVLVKAIIAAIGPWGLLIIGATIVLGIIASWFRQTTTFTNEGMDIKQEKSVEVENLSSEVSKTWISLFYQRFSDMAFYAQVEHPEDGEVDPITGVSFKEITGFDLDEIEEDYLYQGDSAFLREHNIKDFENHEAQLVLSWNALQQLDEKLNSPYIYPEQFIKPLYASCTKDGFAEYYDSGEKVEDCSLVDDDGNLFLSEAESTKYVFNNSSSSEGETLAKLHETLTANSEWTKSSGRIRGNWDWGLGSIIKYKTFYQSSKIEGMHIDKIIGWDDEVRGLKEFKNPTSADYQKYFGYDFFVPNPSISYTSFQDAIKKSDEGNAALGIKNESWHNAGSSVLKWLTIGPSAQQGTTSTGRLDYVYHDDIDKPGDEQPWWKDEPGNTTGIPDPKVVYGIDYALTPLGAMTVKLNQDWVEIAETESTQYFPYVAVVNDHPEITAESGVPDACNGLCNNMVKIEGYKIISKEGRNDSRYDATARTSDEIKSKMSQSNVAYDANQKFWYNAERTVKQTLDGPISYSVSGAPYCSNGSAVLYTEDGIPFCGNSGELIYPQNEHTVYCNVNQPCTTPEQNQHCGCETWEIGYYEEGETDPKRVYEGPASDYTFGAIYTMTLKSTKKGSLMTNLVYYEDDQPDPVDKVGVDYLQEYVNNYQAMIPIKPNSEGFKCYASNADAQKDEQGFYILESLEGVSPNWSAEKSKFQQIEDFRN